MHGKSAGLYCFPMKEDAKRPSEPAREGRMEQTLCKAAACPLGVESWAAFNLLLRCNLEGEHTHTIVL